MKKILLPITALLCCMLLFASCGGESCSHENSRGGLCLDCGVQWGHFKEYTITFETPSGTTTETLYAGEDVTWPEIQSSDGSEFLGWYVYSNDGGSFFVSDGSEKTKPVTSLPDFDDDGKITLTAVFETKYYNITYVTPFGDGFSGSNPTRYQTGATIAITTEHNSNSSYDIQGWYFDEEFTQPATEISGKSEDITLYAKMYYLPFNTVTELDDGSVSLSDLRPSYGPWNENGENTLIIPETYKGKTIASVSANANYKHLVIESTICTVTNLPTTLESIEVSGNHQTYKSVDGSLYSKDGTVLYRLCLPKNALFAEIPEGVTTIGSDAIKSAALKRLTLPGTLTTIEQQNFNYTTKLFEIYNLSEHITLTAGSSDYGRIAQYAYAVHTDANADSILDDIDGFVFLNTADVKYLIGYTGTDTALTLPLSCNGGSYKIYEYAFRYSDITEITVSIGVTGIENGAFPSTLKKITFDGAGIEFFAQLFSGTSKVEEIHVNSIAQWLSFTFEGGASTPFYGNTAGLYVNGSLVTDVVIPDNTVIHSYAFFGYQHLNSVTVGAGTTVIPAYAFGSSSIANITLSDDVSEITSYAFSNCKNLASIELSSSITSLNASAFEGCDSLIETASDGTRYIGNWLVGASSDLIGDTVVIREGTVGIAVGAIPHNSVKAITIPGSVKYICSNAITGRNIEVINYNAIDAVVNGTGAFAQAGMNGNGITVNVGATVKSIPANLFGGDLASGLLYGTYAANVKSVVFLGNAVKSIGDSAFRCAIYLESITLPESLESIGSSAFLCCYSLKSINIPKNVQAIGQTAFGYCTSLENVYYYAKNASVGSSSGNAPFASVGSDVATCVLTIGSEVAAIPAYAFYNTYFTSVAFEQGAIATSVGDYAFYNNSRLVSVDLPDSVDTIGEYAFAYCGSLTAINGVGLANVHQKAIYQSINMPDDWGYDVYGNIKYYFKTAIEPVSTKITWARFKPGSVIPDNFFQYCMNIQHVYIPDGCTIGNEIFKLTSFSNIDKRLMLQVYFEGNDYVGTGAWRNVITHDGTEYKLGMVVSVNGENVTLGKFKYNVPISKDGFAYELDTKTNPPVATVLGYFATSESLTVGGQIDGYTVYDIEDYAFYMHDGIGNVVVSAIIGDMAFAMSSIKSVTLLDVDDIGTGAFMSCTSLATAELGAIEEIGAYAFNGCTSLSTVSMSSSEQHNAFIRDYAFAGCNSLSEITLPANIYTIGTGAFSQSGLTKAYFTQGSEWYIIADATGGNPDIIHTYTVTTPEALATALVTTYANYYWANKALMQ